MDLLVRVSFGNVEEGHWLLPDAAEAMQEDVRQQAYHDTIEVLLAKIVPRERDVLELTIQYTVA